MILAFALALVLDCKPVELTPFVARGNTKRALTLDVAEGSMTLREGKATLWAAGNHMFKVLFATDDAWVALKGPYPSGGVQIAATKKGAELFTLDPLEHLSAEEKKRVPLTSCGESWFKGWKSGARGELELTVDQGSAPPLTLRVSPAGVVSK